jgi:hypothetical protein
MKAQSYYNERFDCYINIEQGNHVTFVLNDEMFPITGGEVIDTGIRRVESSDVKSDSSIEGLLIPYKDHLSFTGHLSELGFVAAEFAPV